MNTIWKKIKMSTLSLVFVSLLLSLFISCSGGVGTGILGGGDLGGLGGGNATEEGIESTATEPESAPMASIPLPMAVEPIIFAPDSEANYPATGTASEGEYVVMSAEPMVSYNMCHGPMGRCADEPMLKVASKYISNSANQLLNLVVPQAHAATGTCESTDSVTYCPVNEDGTFECFAQFDGLSVSEISFAEASVIDGECALVTEATPVPVQANMHYLGNAGTDIKIVNGNIMALTDANVMVQATADEDDTIAVNGDAENDYVQYTFTGSKFDYDTSGANFYGVLNTNSAASGGGLNIYENESLLGTSVCNESAGGFTAVKYRNGALYYSVAAEQTGEAYICNAYRSFARIEFETVDNIRFIAALDVDEAEQTLTHARTIGFDVNNAGFAIVIYQDTAGNYRTAASDGSTLIHGSAPIAATGLSTFDFRDIAFYDSDKALLVDASNNAIWQISLDIDGNSVTSNLENKISVNNPVAITFDANKYRAYILSGTDQKVSVLNLVNDDESRTPRETPTIVASKNLSDIIVGDAAITFTPELIALSNDNIIVGNQRSFINISLTSFAETTIGSEDNDGDGYDVTEDCDDTNDSITEPTLWYIDADGDGHGIDGEDTVSACLQPTGFVDNADDCNDISSSIYPGADELCDDIDNDCDETVDEEVVMVTWYADLDRDSFGDPELTEIACSKPGRMFVTRGRDCNDDDALVNPNAAEVCGDGVDNDCDRVIDETTAEVCDDGIDNDCDGELDGADSDCAAEDEV